MLLCYYMYYGRYRTIAGIRLVCVIRARIDDLPERSSCKTLVPALPSKCLAESVEQPLPIYIVLLAVIVS